ncbi:hypothetical protein D3C84_1012920 [compost metagenome]
MPPTFSSGISHRLNIRYWQWIEEPLVGGNGLVTNDRCGRLLPVSKDCNRSIVSNVYRLRGDLWLRWNFTRFSRDWER